MGKEIIRFHFAKLSCGGVAEGLQEPQIELLGAGRCTAEVKNKTKQNMNAIQTGKEKKRSKL